MKLISGYFDDKNLYAVYPRPTATFLKFKYEVFAIKFLFIFVAIAIGYEI